jgi:DNA modification methylase
MFWFWDNLENPNFNEKITSKHIWHKTNGYQAGHFETICCYHGDGERHEQKVFSFANVGGDNLRQDQGNHPTPKPKSLMVSLLDEAKARMVMDPFAGSGSTMIAAAMTGRICRTMEIAPRYCDVIRRRWTKFAKENNVEPGTGALE